MAGYGEIYVPVDASTVNGGIMTLAGSGEIPGGEGVVGLMAWITWAYDDAGNGGYTNKGWFWGDPNNDLQSAWTSFCVSLGYDTDENGFKKWLSDKKPEDLNDLLGDWDLKRKEAFVNANMNLLGVYPANPTGCIEIHA